MTPEQIQTLVRGHLSARSKALHAVLLVAAAAMAIVVASIWITEAALPARTQVAFAVLVVIALGWVAHATWVLTHTAILLVPHQVQAARLSVGACVLFLGGCVAAQLIVGGPAALLALASALVMTAVSVLNFRTSRARFHALMRRREALMQKTNEATQ